MPLSVDIEEKFVFDLDGYIVIENVLSEREVDELNAIADEKMKKVDGKYRSVGRPSTWGKPFQKLLDHPKIMPYLLDIFGVKGAH